MARPSIWDVTLREHRVGGEIEGQRVWRIPGGVYRGLGLTKEQGAADAIRNAHKAVGVAPWKPYLRASVPHVVKVQLNLDPEAAAKRVREKMNKKKEKADADA